MKEAFVKNNIIDFYPHCCWAASTSKAKSIKGNIGDIIIRCCWENRKTFFKFYDKKVAEFAPDDMDFNFIYQKQTLFVELMENNFGVDIMMPLKYL